MRARFRALLLLACLVLSGAAGAQGAGGSNGEDQVPPSSGPSTREAYLRIVAAVDDTFPRALDDGNETAARRALDTAREHLDTALAKAVGPDAIRDARHALDAADAALDDGRPADAVAKAAAVPGHLQAGAWAEAVDHVRGGRSEAWRPMNVLYPAFGAEGITATLDAYRAWQSDSDNASRVDGFLGSGNATGLTGVYARAALAMAALEHPRAPPLVAGLGAPGTAPEDVVTHLAARVGARNASAAAVEAALARPATTGRLLNVAEAAAPMDDPAVADAFDAARDAVDSDGDVAGALANLSAVLRAMPTPETPISALPEVRLVRTGEPEVRDGRITIPYNLTGLAGLEGELQLDLNVTPAGMRFVHVAVADADAGFHGVAGSGGLRLRIPADAPDPLPLELVSAPLPAAGTYEVLPAGGTVRLDDGRLVSVHGDGVTVHVPAAGADPAGDDARLRGDAAAEIPLPAFAAGVALAAAALGRRLKNG